MVHADRLSVVPDADRKRRVRRRPLPDVTVQAQRFGREAVEKLVDLMRNGKPDIARRAAVDLLDRGYGTPVNEVKKQSPEHAIDPRMLSDERLMQLIASKINSTAPKAVVVRELGGPDGDAAQ